MFNASREFVRTELRWQGQAQGPARLAHLAGRPVLAPPFCVQRFAI